MTGSATSAASIQMDPTKLDALLGKVGLDMGVAMHAALVVIGDKLGLYKAMAGASPITSAELAAKTNTSEPCARVAQCQHGQWIRHLRPRDKAV
jgi:hypothetical protein